MDTAEEQPTLTKKSFDSLVKSFFINAVPEVVPDRNTDIPGRAPSRMGFRDTTPLKPRHKVKRVPVPDIEEEDACESNDVDEESNNSDSSDEWSADSDTGDSGVIFYTPSSSFSTSTPSPEPAYSPIASESPLILTPPPRPTIPHHGLSRSALQHQKWMWNARYDEWMQWQLETEHAAAEASVYGGIADTPSASPPPFRRTPTPEPELKTSQNIFPRTGDLAALHDPQAANLDRAFCNYPLCTIQKVLFVFNMDQRRKEAECACEEVRSMDGSEENSLNSTLIDESREASPVSDSSPSKMAAQASDWTARWQVFTELVKPPTLAAHDASTKPNTVTTSIGLPVVARSLEEVTDDAPAENALSHFFFAEEEDPEPNSDDEDYGEVLVHPRFARGVEVAREFLENEMRRVDCRSGAKMLQF